MKSRITKVYLSSGSAFGAMVAYAVAGVARALAAPPPPPPSGPIHAPVVADNVSDVVYGIGCHILDWFFTIMLILGVVFILVAAYKYITSNGESEKVKSATKSLTYGIVGIAVAILAYSVPIIVNHFFTGDNETAVCGR